MLVYSHLIFKIYITNAVDLVDLIGVKYKTGKKESPEAGGTDEALVLVSQGKDLWRELQAAAFLLTEQFHHRHQTHHRAPPSVKQGEAFPKIRLLMPIWITSYNKKKMGWNQICGSFSARVTVTK